MSAVRGAALRDMKGPILSDREFDVLQRRFHGATNKEIAYDLGCSEQAVKNAQYNVALRLKVSGLWETLQALGWLSTGLADELARITAIRAAARAELLALADAVVSGAPLDQQPTTRATGPGPFAPIVDLHRLAPIASDTCRQAVPGPVAQPLTSDFGLHERGHGPEPMNLGV